MQTRRSNVALGAVLVLVPFAIAFASGCLDQKAPSGPGLTINVAPLSLPNVSNVCYDLRVANDQNATVWSLGDRTKTFATGDATTVCSTQFGNGAGGDIAYVGTCDASDTNPDDGGVAMNNVTLWVDGVYGAGGSDPHDWRDPCPNGCTLSEPCSENADTAVTFNLTVMRSAQQGFFDVAVSFEDIFCSGKVDVVPQFLIDHGTRAPTAIVAVACTTGGNSTPTTLYLDHVTLACPGHDAYVVDPIGPGGSLGAQPDGLFDTAVYHGLESLPDLDKCYWNTALGLANGDIGASCVLSTDASASQVVFAEAGGAFHSPDHTAYPRIHFSVEVTDELGDPEYGAHPMDGGNGVGTVYSDVSATGGDAYAFAMRCGEDPRGAGDGGGTSDVCGDRSLGESEDCDPPNVNGCNEDCTCADGWVPDGTENHGCTLCGNGTFESFAEDCDVLSGAPRYENCDADTCTCTNDYAFDDQGGCGFCGDNIVDGPEDCDNATSSDTKPNCLAGCTCDPEWGLSQVGNGGCAFCGDGALDGPEECDWQNINQVGGCNRDCTCSDGPSQDEVAGDCAACGDGYWDSAYEDCDPQFDGNPNCAPSDAVDASPCTCINGYGTDGNGSCEQCGDGAPNGPEECDWASSDAAGLCNGDCTCQGGVSQDGVAGDCAVCGDTFVDAGETCDDGEEGSTTCTPDCNCGSDIHDRPFADNGDGTCGFCGDGAYDPDHETCDSGEDGPATCTSDCVCGSDQFGNDYSDNGDGTCGSCGDDAWDPASEDCEPDFDPFCNDACFCDEGESDGQGGCDFGT